MDHLDYLINMLSSASLTYSNEKSVGFPYIYNRTYVVHGHYVNEKIRSQHHLFFFAIQPFRTDEFSV